MYIHEQKEWPNFHWDQNALVKPLAEVRYRQGCFLGRMASLGFELQQEAVLSTVAEDVVKTSEIEGQSLNLKQVRSSVARRLGLESGGLQVSDRNVDGVVEMILDATQNYDQRLTKARMLAWHSALFPTGRSGMKRIKVGRLRASADDPMQVVSGPLGREHVHFEAPAGKLLTGEVSQFLKWFNAVPVTDEVLKAGLAHLWFVTLHPFEDGNGRIARAISDMALARSEKSPKRFYSMSAQIRQEYKIYYDILEKTQKGSLDVTVWMAWFVACLGRALEGANTILADTLFKANFWKRVAGFSFNRRQRMLLNRLLDGFHGNLTTTKWARIANCSPDTALRDIAELLACKVLARSSAGGRSTNYILAGDITSETKLRAAP